MATPTIQAMVQVRLPFEVTGQPLTNAIEVFKMEAFYELQKVFQKSDVQLEDEAEYKGNERSIVADIVAIQMLMKRALTNMEGSEGNAASGNKILKKAKAGSVEAEFEIADSKKGSKLLASFSELMGKLKADLNRKAGVYGFIFDFGDAGELLIQAIEGPGIQFVVYDFEQ